LLQTTLQTCMTAILNIERRGQSSRVNTRPSRQCWLWRFRIKCMTLANLHALRAGSISIHTASYLCPVSVASSRWGARTSHTLMVLSTLPVAIMQSLYLHQSAHSTCGCAQFQSGTCDHIVTYGNCQMNVL